MASADDISRTIEPGSIEYGDRQVVEERIAQVMKQGQASKAAPSGVASGNGMERLQQGPVSDLPVTSGLSLGPGSGPAPDPLAGITVVEQLRLIAQHGRSPELRVYAQKLLRSKVYGN